MSELAINADHLVFSYRHNTKTLYDVGLKVEKGKIYSFLGPNGAGKSTTIKLLLGLLTPSRGEISILGIPSQNRQAINKQIGVLVESPGLYEHLSGYKNIEIQADLRNVGRQRIIEVIQQVGMEKAAAQKVKTYSTGMKQRIGLAVALLQKPDLLVLDEPTNGLDPKGIREIRDLLIDLNRDLGITIFLSTHLLSEAERLSHQIGIIQKGRLVFEGSQQELQAMKTSAAKAVVNTNDNSKAIQLLGEHYSVIQNQDGRLLLDCPDNKTMAEVIRRLVDHKLDVYHASVFEEDLEEMFLNLTKD
ncbi:MAG: ABC transporter ATP-binding protein [Bacteroidales bacterium]